MFINKYQLVNLGADYRDKHVASLCVCLWFSGTNC